jgi:hypothetical protein
MEFANFEEFWKALGRLYDSTLKNTEDIRELRESSSELRESTRELRDSTRELREAATLLANAVQRDHDVIMAHEHRLDRTEITVEAVLEDLRRHREGRSPQ